MDKFKASDLRELLRNSSPPCVSIYMRTMITAPDHHQNPVSLSNLLRKAQSELPTEHADNLLHLAWKLIDDESFWKGRSKGLAVFASQTQFRSFRLPVPFTDAVEVNERFVLRPLFPMLADDRLLLLTLSRNRVRLFEATPYELADITLPTLPSDLKTALNTAHVDRGSQVHSASPHLNGKQAAVFHGQGGQVDTIKDETAQFFRMVDAALHDLGTRRALPLVLAGVEADIATFRALTRHSHVVDEAIHGNIDHLSERDLHQLALPVLTSLSDRLRKRAIARLGEVDHGRVTTSLRDILPAVYEGRIDTLFLRADGKDWGTYFPDSGLVQLHSSREPGGEDLLEVAAVETVSHGGTVVTVEEDELPGHSTVAAMLRY
jgi:hypothetical protein